MPRRLRHTTDPSRSIGTIAALVSALPCLAVILNAFAQGDIHPVAGLMAGAIAAALAIRWIIQRHASSIARRLETTRRPAFSQGPPPRGRNTVFCSRWRRLEAARTGLVVPADAPRVSRPDSA